MPFFYPVDKKHHNTHLLNLVQPHTSEEAAHSVRKFEALFAMGGFYLPESSAPGVVVTIDGQMYEKFSIPLDGQADYFFILLGVGRDLFPKVMSDVPGIFGQKIIDYLYDDLEVLKKIPNLKTRVEELSGAGKTKEFLEAYLKFFQNPSVPMPYRLANICAKSQKVHLKIFEDDSSEKFPSKVISSSSSDVESNNVSLYLTYNAASHAHFVLVPISILPSLPIRGAKKPRQLCFTKDLNIITQQKNKYGDNLLHRAVRGLAFEQFIPFLLDYGFDKRVNELNIYSKTALSRFIKYLSEYKKDILTHYKNQKSYIDKICSILFTNFMEKGANPLLKDNEQKNTCDRIAAYQKDLVELGLQKQTLEFITGLFKSSPLNVPQEQPAKRRRVVLPGRSIFSQPQSPVQPNTPNTPNFSFEDLAQLTPGTLDEFLAPLPIMRDESEENNITPMTNSNG